MKRWSPSTAAWRGAVAGLAFSLLVILTIQQSPTTDVETGRIIGNVIGRSALFAAIFAGIAALHNLFVKHPE